MGRGASTGGRRVAGESGLQAENERLRARVAELERAIALDRHRFENSPIPMTDEDWSGAKAIVDRLHAEGFTDIVQYVRDHPELLAELAPAVKILDVNPAAVRVYAAPSREALIEAFNSPPDLSSYNPTTGLSDIFVTLVDRFSKGEVRVELEGPDTTLDGRIIYIRTTTSIARGHEHDWARVLQTVEDFTRRRQEEDDIRYKAMTDSLTGLASRAKFDERLVEVLSHGHRHGESVALLVVDLDAFKPVNDTFGHPVGDAVLAEVGERLKALSRDSDLAARLGGDEFAVILTAPEDRDAAAAPAQRIIEGLSVPVRVGDDEIAVGASIGIALFPDDAKEPAELRRRADAALYAAKSTGGGTYVFWTPPEGDRRAV